MNQQQHDQRSLEWHRLVVKRMREEPALLEGAKATLRHWQSLGQRPNRFYLAEWEKALNEGIDAVEQLATDPSERGNSLRQCSPVSGQLSSERHTFRAYWRKKNGL